MSIQRFEETGNQLGNFEYVVSLILCVWDTQEQSGLWRGLKQNDGIVLVRLFPGVRNITESIKMLILKIRNEK